MAEPITLAEAKLFMRIDADYTYDDSLIEIMIQANREYLEGELGLSLVPKTGLKFKFIRPCCGQRGVTYLPYGPVSNVTATDSEGDEVTIVNAGSDDQYPYYRLCNTTNITYDAGDWGNSFPASLKQALLMMVATNYENRENFVVGQTVTPITQNAMQLAWKYSRNLYLS